LITLPEYMRKVRRELEMSQEEMAKALNVSYTSINRWENKQVTPSRLGCKSFFDFCNNCNNNILVPLEILEKGENI
jgi:DNA-binding XRE family transcriptional regulator